MIFLPFAADRHSFDGVFMFRCQICGMVAAPGTRATKVVVVSREKVYAQRGASPERGRGRFRGPRKPIDQGGKGHEIVREMTACENCAAKQVTQVLESEPEPEPVVEDETVADQVATTEEATAETPAAEEAKTEETKTDE